MKKTFVLLLVLLLTLQFVPAFNVMAAGTDTDGYILINTAAELDSIRNNLSGYYRLNANINVGYWSPIGTSGSGKMFTGTLDGKNSVTGEKYTITIGGMYTGKYTGLFGYTNGATLKNITLAGSSISNSTSTSYTGSLVGYADGTLNMIECKSSVSVTGQSWTGGLVGYGEHALITNCTYTGNVSGKQYVGGIIGKAIRDTSSTGKPTISKCAVTGTVVGSSSSVGGIVGQLGGGNADQCYVSGSLVKGSSYVGGIAGDLYYTSSTTSGITNCYSTCNVTSTSSTGNAGGIVGDSPATSSAAHTIYYCYATGEIRSEGGGDTGGIVGENGTSTTYSVVNYNYAFNNKIWQKSISNKTIGRVSGSDYGVSSNYARDTMVMQYKSGTNFPATSASKHGSSVSVASLASKTYPNWDFTNIWKVGSPYPQLKSAGVTPDPIGITLDQSNVTVDVGGTAIVTATLLNKNDSLNIATSSDTSRVSVVFAGNSIEISGISPTDEDAPVIVTLKSAMGAPATCYVTVTPPSLDPVGPDDPTELLPALIADEATNTYETMSLTGLSGNLQIPAENLVWTSSDNSIATVVNGKVTAVSPGGKVTITATNEKTGITHSTDILVRERPYVAVTDVVFIPDQITVSYGSIVNLKNPQSYQCLPEDATDKTIVEWKSLDEDIALIGKTNGVMSVIGTGDVQIQAVSKDGAVGELVVHAVNPATGIELSQPDPSVLSIGEATMFNYTVMPEGATFSTVAWNIEPAGVLTFDEITGQAEAIGPGTVLVSVTVDGITSNTIEVTVNPNVVPVSGVAIDPPTASAIAVNETLQLTATISPEDATDKTVTWQCEPSDIATIDENGLLTALQVGTVSVTATASGFVSVPVELTVNPNTIPVSTVTIDPSAATTIKITDTLQFTAIVSPEDATDKTVTWQCEPSSIATIDENGLLTPLQAGIVSVTATAGGVVSVPVEVTVELNTYDLADWNTLYFDQPNSLFYPLNGVAKDGASIGGVGITEFTLNQKEMRAKDWHQSTFNTPKAWIATIPAAGYSNFVVKYSQKANNPSPNLFTLEYSLDGIDWISVDAEYQVRTFTQAATEYTNFEKTITIGPIEGNLYLRWRAGATDWSGSTQRAGTASFLRNVIVTGQQ